MPSTVDISKEKTIVILTELGLSLGEAKTYTELVITGPSEATPLAKKAHVPQPKIYGYLSDLERKGFVIAQKTVGKTNTYKPINYKTVIRALKSGLAKKAEKSLLFFEENKNTSKEEVEHFTYFEGERAVKHGMDNLFLEAKKNLVFLAKNDVFNRYSQQFEMHPDLDIYRIMSEDKLWQKALRKLVPVDQAKKVIDSFPIFIVGDVNFKTYTGSFTYIMVNPYKNYEKTLIHIKHPVVVNSQTFMMFQIIKAAKNIGVTIEKYQT